MEIIFFGQLADIVGKKACTLNNVQDTDMLKATLHSQYPGLENVRYMVAVNRTVIQENVSLSGSETLALMPPFSGG